MKKKDLINLINTLNEEDNVDEVLSKSELAKVLAASGLTLDAFKEKIANDDSFRSFMDSEKDKHHTKAMDTWKTNNLSKLVDDEIKKKYPPKDPKDQKLQELEQKLEQMEKAAQKKDLTNKALKFLTEKKLPSDLVDYFIGEDETVTTKNLEVLEKVFSSQVDSVVQERLKGGYTPPGGGNPQKDEDKMTDAEWWAARNNPPQK